MPSDQDHVIEIASHQIKQDLRQLLMQTLFWNQGNEIVRKTIYLKTTWHIYVV